MFNQVLYFLVPFFNSHFRLSEISFDLFIKHSPDARPLATSRVARSATSRPPKRLPRFAAKHILPWKFMRSTCGKSQEGRGTRILIVTICLCTVSLHENVLTSFGKRPIAPVKSRDQISTYYKKASWIIMINRDEFIDFLPRELNWEG